MQLRRFPFSFLVVISLLLLSCLTQLMLVAVPGQLLLAFTSHLLWLTRLFWKTMKRDGVLVWLSCILSGVFSSIRRGHKLEKVSTWRKCDSLKLLDMVFQPIRIRHKPSNFSCSCHSTKLYLFYSLQSLSCWLKFYMYHWTNSKQLGHMERLLKIISSSVPNLVISCMLTQSVAFCWCGR